MAYHKRSCRNRPGVHVIMNSYITILSLSILVHGAATKEVDPANSTHAPIIQGKNIGIDRLLQQQGNTTFYSSPYSIGMEDMNKQWKNVQMAWHLLGFYIDCTYNNYESDNYQKRVLHNDHPQQDGQEGATRETVDDRHEEEHKADHEKDDEDEGNRQCIRKTLYAVYVDPNYQGGGLGEYRYYDKSSGQYKCYSSNCRAKMDCHSSSTKNWQLLGIFKISKVNQGDGWMEQLFKHAGVCYWGSDDYSFAAAMREKLPNGCQKTKYKPLGRSLYMGIKPTENAGIDLAFYTDRFCTKLYRRNTNTYDVYGLVGTSRSDMVQLNKLLDGYKVCHPCIAYSLSSGDFSCSDDAGYTNCNQCMKFAIKAQSSAATPQDIQLAYLQRGMLSLANLTAEREMSAMEQLEGVIIFEAMNAFPIYLQTALLFFLGCLVFYRLTSSCCPKRQSMR